MALARIPDAPLQLSVLLRGTPGIDRGHADALGMVFPSARRLSARPLSSEAFSSQAADAAWLRERAEKLGVTVAYPSPSRRIVRLSGPGEVLLEMLQPDGRGSSTDAAIRQRVQHIFGFDKSVRARPRLVKRHPVMASVRAELVAGSYSPAEVADLYNFPLGTTGQGQSVGIIHFGAAPNASDITAFFSSQDARLPAFTVVEVFDPSPEFDGTEATLAVQLVGSVAPAARLVVYQSAPTEQGWIEVLRFAVHDEVHAPTVLLVAWGYPEDKWSDGAIAAVEEALEEAAQLGITVICASGNNGSNGDDDDGKCHVDFPAASRLVLCCGGTSLRALQSRITSEVVWNNGPLELGGGGSGGGVSERIALPDWQRAAQVPPSPGARCAGRGLPDVAANADPNTGYRVILDGRSEVVGGTSAAAALWAALVARLNQGLSHEVGFLTPLIYMRLASTGAFREVIAGSNDTSGVIGLYQARYGWNAATGWGSVDGTVLLDALTDRREAKPMFLSERSLGTRWQMIPGLAFDLAAADDGSVWVVSTLPSGAFGSGIYHWNGATWDSIPGGGRRIAVSGQRVYATIATAQMLLYESGSWQATNLFAHDLAAGPDGSVWCVGTTPIQGGFPIYRWSPYGCVEIPSSGAIRIAIGPDGLPWVITWQMQILRSTAFGWQSLPPPPRKSGLVPGEGVDLGIGSNGSVWLVTNPPTDEPSIFHWNGRSWDPVEGAGVAVSVRPDGLPWVITPRAEIYARI
jgi:kumamolisin